MTVKGDGWALLTADVEERGEGTVLDAIMTRIAEGEDPRDIARSRGYSWYVLRRWLEDSPDRMSSWALADRCFADGLAYEGLTAAKHANEENVSVKRLQGDMYWKAAGKLNREKWGDKAQGQGGGGITVVVSRACSLEVDGGVLRIKDDQEKGYPALEIPAEKCVVEKV